jgi:hypothetical protein
MKTVNDRREGVLIMTKRQWLFVLLVTGVISFSLGDQGIAGDDDQDRTCPLPIKVDVFQKCQGAPCSVSTMGGGAPYSSRFGTFRSSDISFATTTGFNWHPFNGGVSKVEMVTPMALIYSVLFPSISTFETPPRYAPQATDTRPRPVGWGRC